MSKLINERNWLRLDFVIFEQKNVIYLPNSCFLTHYMYESILFTVCIAVLAFKPFLWNYVYQSVVERRP